MCIPPDVGSLCKDRILKRNTNLKAENNSQISKSYFVKNQFLVIFLQRPPATPPPPPPPPSPSVQRTFCVKKSIYEPSQLGNFVLFKRFI